MPLDKEGTRKKNKGKGDRFEIREGENLIRVLPADMRYFDEDVDYIAFRMLVHWGLGPEGSPPVCCPRTIDNTNRCPICDKVRKLRRNPENKDIVNRIRAKLRFLFNVIDVNNPGKGIQQMETGKKIHEAIVGYAVDPEWTEDGDIIDIVKGTNIKLEKIPATRNDTGYTQYKVRPVRNISDISELLPNGWKEAIDSLKDTVLVPPSEADLKKLVNDFLSDGDSDDSDDREPTPPKHAKTRKVRREKPEMPDDPDVQDVEEEKAAENTCDEIGKGYNAKSADCRACDDKLECINLTIENA